MSHRRVIPFVAALLLAAPSLGAQQVTGRVLSQTGEPLAAVQVFIAGSGIGALTQQNGRYLLLNVPAGTHTLSAQRIGFQGVTAEITVVAGETLVQDFTLSEEALGLDEIIVTGTAGRGSPAGGRGRPFLGSMPGTGTDEGRPESLAGFAGPGGWSHDDPE